MKELGKFIVYLTAVFVGGALLAPVLFSAAQALIEADVLPVLKKFRFPKYFNRAVLLCALAFLVPFLRSLGLSSWKELGVFPNPAPRRDLGLGFLIGAVGLTVAAGCMLGGGQSVLKAPFNWGNVGLAMGTAVAVGIIEEVFFRGVLYGVMRRHLRASAAIWGLSVVFAALHFLKPHPSLKRFAEEVTWSSGFSIVPKLFWQFSDPRLFVGGFLTLVLVGAILAYATEKTRSLWMPIGLHGGWVFALRVFTLNGKRVGESNFWFGRDLITGGAPLLLLLGTFAILVVGFRWRPRTHE